jgi:ankyrin repeat protein
MYDFKILVIVFSLVFLASPEVFADKTQQLQQINKSIRTRHYSKAVTQLAPLVKSGDAEAQFLLAGLYRSGKGTKKDLDRAMGLYEKAAKSGHADAQYTLASLLEKRGDIDQAFFWYHEAADQGQRKAQRKLKAARNAKENLKSQDLDSDKVFSAIIHNDIQQIKTLIDAGYDFNIQDDSARSPLIAALLAEHKELADLLLPVTKNLKHADKNQNQAIHVATANSYDDIVQKLLNKNVDINARDNLGNTPLLIAIRHDDARLTKLLLNNKADYNLDNKRRVSALELAQTRADPDVKKVFAQKGIKFEGKQRLTSNVSIKDFEKSISQSSSLYKGWPILSIACLLGEEDIAQQLLKQGANVNASDSSGFTALHRASSKNQVKTVKLLLANGAVINAKNDKGETPVFLAAETGGLETVEYLVAKGADTSILSSNKTSPLAVAISNQRNKVAMLLAEQDLDAVSLHTAAMLSIQKSLQNVSLKLIPRDKLINEVDNNKHSLLWFSADKGMEKSVAAILLNKSVDLNQKDSKGFSPLSRAVLKGHTKIARLLIAIGADINTKTSEKNTLLMQSVISGEKDMTQYLIDKKLDINAKNNSGETALMLAAGAGNNDLVEILIAAGADIQTRNQDDLSAYEIALNAGKKDTAELIREKSGRLFKLFN